jgi:hypothetical protein
MQRVATTRSEFDFDQCALSLGRSIGFKKRDVVLLNGVVDPPWCWCCTGIRSRLNYWLCHCEHPPVLAIMVTWPGGTCCLSTNGAEDSRVGSTKSRHMSCQSKEAEKIELERPNALVWMQNGKFYEVYGDVARLMGRLLDLLIEQLGYLDTVSILQQDAIAAVEELQRMCQSLLIKRAA